MPQVGEPQPSKAESEAIREVELRRLRCLVAADMAEAERLHAPDFEVITPRGSALSRQQYLGAVAVGDIKYLTWQPGAISVRLHGEAAVIRYQAELEMTSKGRPSPRFRCWHTDLYERRGGSWQVVWSQATKID